MQAAINSAGTAPRRSSRPSPREPDRHSRCRSYRSGQVGRPRRGSPGCRWSRRTRRGDRRKGSSRMYPLSSTIRTSVKKTAAPPRRIWIPFEVTLLTNGAPARATDADENRQTEFRRSRFAAIGMGHPTGPVRPSPAEHERHDERTPRDPEVKVAAARQRDRYHAQAGVRAPSRPRRDEGQLGTPLELSPKKRRLLLGGRRERDHQTIAELEGEVGGGKQIARSPRRTCEIRTGKSGSGIVRRVLPTNAACDT